jgi:choline dehydrogenase
MRELVYDYIVIGAGSAGCVLANRLSADPKNNVLLIEAGGRDRHPLAQLPLLGDRLVPPRIDSWRYETEPEPGLGNRRISWPLGKGLGGTSTLAGMACLRGSRHDYDRWAQLGLPGWAYEEVLPWFRRSEGHAGRRDAFHGQGGELDVRRARSKDSLLDRFIEAGREAGHAVNDDFNGESQEGFGRYDLTVRTGRRCSPAEAFLRPVLKRPNLTIVSHALARRIVIENNKAVAVDITAEGQDRRVRAGREVVLSAGAVNSPQILMLSGIGNADELVMHGIRPVHHLPGVGKNLQDHVEVGLVYEVTRPVAPDGRFRIGRLARSVPGRFFGKDTDASFPREAGTCLGSQPGLEAPDIQARFMPTQEKAAERVTIRVGPVDPGSRGAIMLRSAKPGDPPRIFANYLATDGDRTTAIAGVKLMREVMAQRAFKDVIGRELAPGPDVKSDGELRDWLKQAAGSALHPAGTCKMGTAADRMAVVDAELRVHGIERLRVADASVMPVITSGGTSAPAIMIGEKCADMVLRANA